MTRRQIQPEESDESQEPLAAPRMRQTPPQGQPSPTAIQQGISATLRRLQAIQIGPLALREILWTLGFLVIGLVLYVVLRAIGRGTLPAATASFRSDQILPTLFSLAAIALFLERAVEVLIDVAREPAKVELERAVTVAGNDRTKKALDDYTAETKRFARLIIFVAGLTISFLGARTLEPIIGGFTVTSDLKDLATFIDVIVTALIVTGGSDGIHQIIRVYTARTNTTN
jgi:hypothetical protein